jgi:hypothetical protein
MYLILAAVWLLGAIAVFSYEWRTGDVRWRFLGGSVSSAWVMVVFALYNVAQWWARRAQRAEQEAMRLAYEERLRQARPRERPAAEPDPTFDFTDRKE